MNISDIYTAEELNEMLRIIASFTLLFFATTVGNFTRNLMFSIINPLRENIGMSLFSGFIAFGINIKYGDDMSLAISFLICVLIGFFTPSFKSWFKDKTILKFFIKAYRATSTVTDNILQNIDEKLDDDDTKED